MKIRKSQQHLWLSKLNARGALLEQEAKEFYWKECGHEGENNFAAFAEREKAASWQWLFDLRLQAKAGEIQVDAVLICEVGWITFEVKNYRAAYQFSEKQLTVNGEVNFHNAFRQAERSSNLFHHVFKQFSAVGDLRHYIVFINEEDTVDVDGGNSKIPYLKHGKLRQFFRDLRRECETLANLPAVFNRDFLLEATRLRAMHKIDNRRYSLTDERFTNLKKGLQCEQCQKFNLRISRYYVICQECSFCESKEKATMRLVSTLGILLPFESLNPKKVHQLSGGMLEYRTISSTMAKYLTRHSGQPSYINTNLSFYQQFEHTNFRYKDKVPPYKIRH